jgi:hypothetical protein
MSSKAESISWDSTFNPFLFKKINDHLYLQRVSPPLKNRPDMLSEGSAAHPLGCDSPIQIVIAVWRPFCLNSNFLCRVWQPSADNNGVPKGHYYLQRAVTLDQITQQNSLQRTGASQKAEKALWGPISRPILDLGLNTARAGEPSDE